MIKKIDNQDPLPLNFCSAGGVKNNSVLFIVTPIMQPVYLDQPDPAKNNEKT
jgi:hypothetical protein